MPRYDSLRKTGRDRQIRAFARKHPSWSQQEIADRFGLKRSNISRILNTVRRKPAEADNGK